MIRTFYDQFYSDARDVRQSYDLTFPSCASGSTGLLLCIHGGGWIEGSKDEYAKTLRQVSEDHGVGAACINYRYVSDSVSFDDVLDDVTSALTAIRAKGEKCGVQFDRVLLTGISAGAHISLLYAYARKDVSPMKPVCVVSLCGPTDLEDPFYYSEENSISKAVDADYFRSIISHGVGCPISLDDFDAARPALRRCSPIWYVDKDTVPTVFGHGEQDEIVPYRNALALDEKLTQCGVEHVFVSFPHSGHACEDEKSKSEMLRLLFDYVDKCLK